MQLGMSPKGQQLLDAVTSFMDKEVYQSELKYAQQVVEGERWCFPEVMAQLQEKARAQGLWNLLLPGNEAARGLNNVDFAHLAEQMGRSAMASEVFNCSSPDLGNMEMLTSYGNDQQKDQWLAPLLRGEIRSAFALSEAEVASSDETNIASEMVKHSDHWLINGEKTFVSGAGDPRCKFLIFMGVSDSTSSPDRRHTQLLVPMDSAGVEIDYMLQVFGYDNAPHGHARMRFNNVKVPLDSVLLAQGRGLEIVQSRIGAGRVHSCMRAIGQAERALSLMCDRAVSRVAFGQPLSQLGGNGDIIANARVDLEMARLLTLKAAYMLDEVGNRVAASEIAQIKVAVPGIALRIMDQAIQMYGGAGVSQDTPLAKMFASMRTLRLADGPDEVHRRAIARYELAKHPNR